MSHAAVVSAPIIPVATRVTSMLDRLRQSLPQLIRETGSLTRADGLSDDTVYSRRRSDVAKMTGERASLSLESAALVRALDNAATEAGYAIATLDQNAINAARTAQVSAAEALIERIQIIERELRAHRRLQGEKH